MGLEYTLKLMVNRFVTTRILVRSPPTIECGLSALETHLPSALALIMIILGVNCLFPSIVGWKPLTWGKEGMVLIKLIFGISAMAPS
jgi:hypothetical protein